MKYLVLFIRIFADKALQIKLNIKRNWKFFKKEFRKEPILHKKSRVFRRNFVKYTRLYRLFVNVNIRMYNFDDVQCTVIPSVAYGFVTGMNLQLC